MKKWWRNHRWYAFTILISFCSYILNNLFLQAAPLTSATASASISASPLALAIGEEHFEDIQEPTHQPTRPPSPIQVINLTLFELKSKNYKFIYQLLFFLQDLPSADEGPINETQVTSSAMEIPEDPIGSSQRTPADENNPQVEVHQQRQIPIHA